MTVESSLALYKKIVENQRRIEYAVSLGHYFGIGMYARTITAAYKTLQVRAETIGEQSAKIQLRKIQKTLSK